jgi:hypothetical protein
MLPWGQRKLKKSSNALASPNALSTRRRTPDRPHPPGLPPQHRTPLPLLPHLQLPSRRQPLQTHLSHLRLLPQLRRLLLAPTSTVIQVESEIWVAHPSQSHREGWVAVAVVRSSHPTNKPCHPDPERSRTGVRVFCERRSRRTCDCFPAPTGRHPEQSEGSLYLPLPLLLPLPLPHPSPKPLPSSS